MPRPRPLPKLPGHRPGGPACHSRLRQVTISGELGYLLGRLDWCATQQWVADLAEDVSQLHAQARAMAGDQPPAPIGRYRAEGCHGVVFPANLRDPGGSRSDGARCKHCGQPYTGLHLVSLVPLEAS